MNHELLALLHEIIAILGQKLAVAVIYSGDNRVENAVLQRTYHPRHWKSYEKVACDIRDAFVGFGFKRVHHFPDDMSLLENLKRHEIGLAWLNTGGVQGRNSIAHAATLLEMAGVPYIGHNPLNTMILDHKLVFKRLLLGFGIETPAYHVWNPAEHLEDRDGYLRQFRSAMAGENRWIVKPVTGRGSRFIHVVVSERQLLEAITDVYQQTNSPVLVEAFLPGREFCVASGPGITFRENRFHWQEGPLLLSPVERKLGEGEWIFTSMDTKPIDLSRAQLIDQEREPELLKALLALCQSVYASLMLKNLIRLDVRQNSAGQLSVMEANPKPDLARPDGGKTSLVAMGLSHKGLSYPDFIMGLLGAFLYDTISVRPASMPGIFAVLEDAGLKLAAKPIT